MAYINETPEDDTIKLLKDLLDYYETHYEYEIETNAENSGVFKQCKNVMECITYNKNPLASVAVELKEKFSSTYLSVQINLMLKMQSKNSTEVIGKAKELIESCCKTILDEKGVGWDKNWDVGKLTNATIELLKRMSIDRPDTAPTSAEMKAILGNLRSIATNLAALRNPYGSGHGKSATYKGLEERHAKLAVGSSITLVSFL